MQLSVSLELLSFAFSPTEFAHGVSYHVDFESQVQREVPGRGVHREKLIMVVGNEISKELLVQHAPTVTMVAYTFN